MFHQLKLPFRIWDHSRLVELRVYSHPYGVQKNDKHGNNKVRATPGDPLKVPRVFVIISPKCFRFALCRTRNHLFTLLGIFLELELARLACLDGPDHLGEASPQALLDPVGAHSANVPSVPRDGVVLEHVCEENLHRDGFRLAALELDIHVALLEGFLHSRAGSIVIVLESSSVLPLPLHLGFIDIEYSLRGSTAAACGFTAATASRVAFLLFLALLSLLHLLLVCLLRLLARFHRLRLLSYVYDMTGGRRIHLLGFHRWHAADHTL
mmetsp:Transcript_132955/g.284177  ORF Transcript_132955/g.284177 Transcript_132955/m.284177 type:complete len:267 (-) Transcript_132955:118-918(-)